MVLSALELENYKAFAQRRRLELRPLTLLFGANNAGKSALLRTLPLLGDSLSSVEMSPIDFDHPAIRGARFHDLRWRGGTPKSTISFRFQWNEGPIEFYEVGIGYEDNWNRVLPKRIKIKARNEPVRCFRWDFVDEERLEQELTFRIDDDGPESVSILWAGLHALGPKDQSSGLFEDLHDSLKPLAGRVQWLTSVRNAPPRLSSPVGSLPRRLSHRGDGCVSTLHIDDDVRAGVSRWYEKHLSRRLRVIEENRMLRTVLAPLEEATFDIDLVDCGEGLIQALPVLTALATLRQRRADTPSVLAIEEPESHLHPKLQRALAEHLCEIASDVPDGRIVLETHSEHLLLGIRLAVLEGTLDRTDVAIHWVTQTDDGSSDVRLAELDENADLESPWPPSVFGDDTEMARKIWELRRRGVHSGEQQ